MNPPVEFRDAVMARVEPMLARLHTDGHFVPDDPQGYLYTDSQFIFPLVWFHATRFPGNRYYHDSRILDAVTRIGDHMARATGTDGCLVMNSYGYVLPNLDQRFLYFWMLAYPLVRTKLRPARRRAWEAAMHRSLYHVHERVRRWKRMRRFNDGCFGTGPNHTILYAAALLLGGRLFRRADWRCDALAFAERFAAYQDPEGFFSENHGPVGSYHRLSAAGVDRFAAMTGRKDFIDCSNRAAAYEETVTYPDFSFVETTDGRVRYRREPWLWGLHLFSHTPRGRAFARRLFAAHGGRPMSGEIAALVLESFLLWRSGPEAPFRPWRGARRLGSHALMLRERGWEVALSAWPRFVNPDNPFHLDSGVLFSVWREGTGLVVSGSQEKRHAEHFTFRAPGGVGVLFGGRICDKAADAPPYVEALYTRGEAGARGRKIASHEDLQWTGRIAARIVSARKLELTVSPEGNLPPGLCVNLPFPVGVGAVLTAGSRRIVLTGRRLALPVRKGTPVRLFDGRISATLSGSGRLLFPCLPFNSYAKDCRSPMSAAFLRLEAPVGRGLRIRLTFAPEAAAPAPGVQP